MRVPIFVSLGGGGRDMGFFGRRVLGERINTNTSTTCILISDKLGKGEGKGKDMDMDKRPCCTSSMNWITH